MRMDILAVSYPNVSRLVGHHWCSVAHIAQALTPQVFMSTGADVHT